MYLAHTDLKKSGVTIVISDMTDYNSRKIIKDKETLHDGKGVNYQRKNKIFNMYAPNKRVLK